jgi:hypothetical protein
LHVHISLWHWPKVKGLQTGRGLIENSGSVRKPDTTFIAPIARESVIAKMGKTDGAMLSILNMPKEWETQTAQHQLFKINLSSIVKREVSYLKHDEKAEPKLRSVY